jgi:hypothetical protein
MAALVSGVAVTACMGGGRTAATGASVVTPWTRAPSSTSTQNWNRPGITPASAARFDEASGAARRFKEKYSLPFTLLADPEHRVADDYGV